MSKNLNEFQNATVGMAVGCIEVRPMAVLVGRQTKCVVDRQCALVHSRSFLLLTLVPWRFDP